METTFDLDLLEEIKRAKTYSFLAGTDEVGRGPLAGPVVAVTFFVNFSNFVNVSDFSIMEQFIQTLRQFGVTDSKKLSKKKREKILNQLGIEIKIPNLDLNNVFDIEISKNFSAFYSISVISPNCIDEINILNASLLAMKSSFENCLFRSKNISKGILLIDGNKCLDLQNISVEQRAIVKGDGKHAFIGLASIIAKEYRDNLMTEMDKIYPQYGFAAHSGYPTSSHRKAIASLGVTEIHRKTFKGVKEFVVN